jgi:hypothetical protein
VDALVRCGGHVLLLSDREAEALLEAYWAARGRAAEPPPLLHHSYTRDERDARLMGGAALPDAQAVALQLLNGETKLGGPARIAAASTSHARRNADRGRLPRLCNRSRCSSPIRYRRTDGTVCPPGCCPRSAKADRCHGGNLPHGPACHQPRHFAGYGYGCNAVSVGPGFAAWCRASRCPAAETGGKGSVPHCIHGRHGSFRVDKGPNSRSGLSRQRSR